MKPTRNLSLDAHRDSNFARVWHHEYVHLRDSCLSQTGFITVLAGVPIHWSSKVQTETALSSTEAEYITLLPMRRAQTYIL
jgi:hypothetical protein